MRSKEVRNSARQHTTKHTQITASRRPSHRLVPGPGLLDEFVLSGSCLARENDDDSGKCFFRPARQLKTPPEAPTSSSSGSEKKAAGHAKLQKQRGPGMLKMDPLLRIG